MAIISEMSFLTRILIGSGALAEVPGQLGQLEVAVPLVVTDAGVVQAGLYARLQKLLAEFFDIKLMPLFYYTITTTTIAYCPFGRGGGGIPGKGDVLLL